MIYKNKLKIKTLIFMLLFFTISIYMNKVNATEELPDNGAVISSAQVIQTKTGTGPWDSNDEPGNDSSEYNNIVRSFDQVTWTIENTMILNNSTSDSYTGGRIYFEATLPDVLNSEIAKWDLDSMGWISNANISSDGMTITGYYQMGNDNITVPGKQTLIFISKIEGAGNGTEFAPIIKIWLNGNTEENYISVVPKKTIVSSAPSYNIKLARNNQCNKRLNLEFDSNSLEGRMYGYSFVLQLYNKDNSKGLKGIEFPNGDITFDIDLKFERTDFNSLDVEDITDECTPLLWNYKVNNTSNEGNIPGRIMMWGNYDQRYDSRNVPSGELLEDRNNSIYNSGNIIMQQNGSKIIVTVSDYQFDGTYPKYNREYTSSSSIVYTENIGCFCSGYFQIFVPDNEASTVEDKNYYLNVTDSNLVASSITGQTITTQTITTDDKTSLNHIRLIKGSYDHFIDLTSAPEYEIKGLYNRGRGGDTVLTNGNPFYTYLTFQTNSQAEEEFYIHSLNQIYKFDGEGLEPYSDKIIYTSNSGLKFNAYYLTKKDGTNWSSQEEMNNTSNIEDFNLYKNKSDIPNNYVCVGIFFESIESGRIQPSWQSIYVKMKVKDNAPINRTYGMTLSTKAWDENNKLDRSIYTVENKDISISNYPKESFSKENKNYIKTEYTEDGRMVSGTHNGNYYWGNTVYVVGALQKVELSCIDVTDNLKVNFDLGKSEYDVRYKIQPILSSSSNNIYRDNITVTITDTLPKGLTYVPGSSDYGDPDIKENIDGTTTLIWKIYNCVVEENIEPIYFSAHIYEESANGTQYSNKVVMSADKIGNPKEASRTDEYSIQVTNLASHRLYKTMITPVIEKNGEIHFTLSYKNHTDETIPDFQLLDILPYNGDSRGTNFAGTYTLDRIVVTQEDSDGNKLSNDNLQILYTNDEDARSVTSKDSNLGNEWTKVDSENIKQSATVIAVKGEVGPQGKVNVDVYLKTSNNKGLDKYVNSATAQVYEATEEITTSNVVSQVVERTIEGIAWEDKNANGIKDANEEVLKNIELTLTDNLGNQVTDVNGNIVSSVRTDENGYYKFENLPKGNYYVNVTIFNSKYDITEKGKGTNTKINSKFNVEAKETDEITKLNSIDLPVLTVSNVNVGFVKKATSIIVKHQTEDGEDLVDPETITGRVDEEYTTKEKEFDEYEIKTIPDNANGVMEEDVIEVIYVYSFVKGKIAITKVDNNDNTKLLSGATFKIEKLNDTTFTTIEKTTGDNGIVEFTDLTIGKYRITETKAPNGYELKSTPIDVEISKNTKEQNILATDRLKLQLPATGGKGMYLFIFSGSILMILILVIRNIRLIKQ